MNGHYNLAGDQNNKLQFDTDRGGYRLVASTDSGVTGRGGDVFAIDDPHTTQGVESDVEREAVITWWRQTVQSRLNDPKSGAFVIIMQRLHEADLSGYILENSDADWVHLCLPMEYEKDRHCVTVVLPDTGHKEPWQDPRTEEGELLAENRFDQKYADLQKREVGPYVYAGQYQQRPSPAGGEIFKLDWWQAWQHNKYPVFDLMVAGVDTAYTEDSQNDYSALSIWGMFTDENGLPQIMLVYAWRDRLQVNDLVNRIAKTCRRPMYPVDRVLIEAKASGISVAQELLRLFGSEDFAVDLVNPKGDKNARALSVQPLFAPSTRIIRMPNGTHKPIDTPGIIWAPDRAWADMLKNEAASFPKGRHDDLVDSMVTALIWLRKSGIAKRREERLQEMVDGQKYQPQAEKLYDV
jgi:predicted phage terminase large subunit-like protein